MKYGFVVSAGSAHEILDLAKEIEEAGWDGFFTWDGISVGPGIDIFDPWAVLAAVAVSTKRVTLGAMIFPLSRRRPWKVAREALTIDHLSDGRLVLPVGLGALDDAGFSRVHPEVSDRKQRAQLLDETLAILELAWTGEPVTFNGVHYQMEDVIFHPRPVQRPRIPVWVVGAWPSAKSVARAARWDGIMLAQVGQYDAPTVKTTREIVAAVKARRGDADAPFEFILEGATPADDRDAAIAQLQPYREAGVTWWIESIWENNDVETLRHRIRQGPPKA